MFNLPRGKVSYHIIDSTCLYNFERKSQCMTPKDTKSFLITLKNIDYPVCGSVRVVVEEHLQLVGAPGVVQ